ncbi:MAG TPA: metallophosphoesterase, partial [Spirochaetia bacterium]|nr:metallophosphoesterase [Spirochaetia bacterium]
MNIISVFLTGAALSVTGSVGRIKEDVQKNYHHIVILSDTHLPGNIIPAKETALQTIASWKDVDRVVVIGDLVATGGSAD